VRTSENYWAAEVRFSEKKVRNASHVAQVNSAWPSLRGWVQYQWKRGRKQAHCAMH